MEPPVVKSPLPLRQRVVGWAFGALMLLSSLFGSFYILSFLIPLIWLKPILYRRIVDRLVGVWLVMPATLMEAMFGSTVTVKGDRIDADRPAIIIMNHRTRLDWLFFWNALYQMDPWLLTSEKISLKAMLKFVPGAGWAMACNCYMFLDRAFAADGKRVEALLDYYRHSGCYQLLLFPEGTDKCPKATQRSKVYAEGKGLPHYDYLVHPKTTGFVHMVQRMRNGGYLEYIYDVSVGYVDSIVQTEIDLVTQGAAPKNVQYQVIKIPVSSLPESDEALAAWLVERWKEKEEKLRSFYSKEPSVREFEQTENGEVYGLDVKKRLARAAIVAFWCSVTVVWMCAFFSLPWHMLWGAAVTAFFVGAYKVYGGVEWVIIDSFKSSLKKVE